MIFDRFVVVGIATNAQMLFYLKVDTISIKKSINNFSGSSILVKFKKYLDRIDLISFKFKIRTIRANSYFYF